MTGFSSNLRDARIPAAPPVLSGYFCSFGPTKRVEVPRGMV